MEHKPRVAFVCVHNSCRSQIAEALGREFAHDAFVSVSAGTHATDAINADAVRLVRDRYDIDMNKLQKPKLIDDLPEVDVVITMGCNVQCPTLPSKHREDWGLDDPSGKSDETFQSVIDDIENKILKLKERIINKEIKL